MLNSKFGVHSDGYQTKVRMSAKSNICINCITKQDVPAILLSMSFKYSYFNKIIIYLLLQYM